MAAMVIEAQAEEHAAFEEQRNEKSREQLWGEVG